MADLREAEGIKLFSGLLEQRLMAESKKPGLKWYQEKGIQETLGMIRGNSYRGLKDITWHHQALVSQIVKEEGFDGLIALEGGEGSEVGPHDSYVVFDPDKIEIKSGNKVG